MGIGVWFWVAGFDVIYACQDVEFDRSHKLHSLYRLGSGTRIALRLAGLAHIAAIRLFMLAGSLQLNGLIHLFSLVTCGLFWYWNTSCSIPMI